MQTLLSPNSSTQFQYTTPVRPAKASKTLLNSIRGRLAETPIKALPFSPSQFFNSPCNANGLNMATSTPVKRGKVRPPHTRPPVTLTCPLSQLRSPTLTDCSTHSSFQIGHDAAALTTPPPNEGENGKPSQVKNKHLSGAGVTRTPTPFKRALAELRKQTVDPNGSGHLVDDITEIIDKENGKGKGGAADSMYETDVSANATGIKVEDVEGDSKRTARKVRKSLLSSAWEMSELPYLAETPVSR